jgi:hypothetical protein
MNNDVCERLIYNLEHPVIWHDQCVWLSDHRDIFVISEEDRWSCATSGCAAGFVFIQEAPDGSIFDAKMELVFNNLAEYYAFSIWQERVLSEEERILSEDLSTPARESPSGERIMRWASQMLGLANPAQESFIFLAYDNAENIIARLRFLMAHPDSEYPEEEFDRSILAA